MTSDWTRLAPAPRPMEDGKAYSVFLSYRSVNRPWVINLYDVLRENGHRPFLDQVRLRVGSDLGQEIGRGLDASMAGILVWSRAAADSEWVKHEYTVLQGKAKDDPWFYFVPVRLDDTPLPEFVDDRIFLDFSAYPDGPSGGELLRLLHGIVGKPLSDEAARFAADQDQAARDAEAAIDAARSIGSTRKLRELFDRGGPSWEASASLGARVAEALTKLGAYDEALAVLDALSERFTKAIRPTQLRALALARRGSKTGSEDDLEDAQFLMAKLYADGHRDPETLGIYARTLMDRYAATGNRLFLAQSRDLYAEAFDGAQDDNYVGINAAAKSVFLGTPADLEKAKAFVGRVEQIVGTMPVPGDYWKSAVVAEVQLIRQNFDAAAELYRKAVIQAPSETGSHGSTWLQAQRLMEAMGAAEAERAKIAAAFAHLG